MELKAGDTVRLKSTSPLMTIRQIISGGKAVCDWVDEKGKPQSAMYPLTSLMADGPVLPQIIR